MEILRLIKYFLSPKEIISIDPQVNFDVSILDGAILFGE